MNSRTLDKLEQQSFRTTVDHGFFDLLLAAATAALTLVFIVSPLFVPALFLLVIAKQPLLKLFNREVVEPRVGHVRLGPARLDQISVSRKTAAFVFFGLAFIVARLGDTESPISTAAPMVWLANTPQFQIAIVFGVGTAVAGWLFGLRRFLSYGLLILLAPYMAAVAHLPAGAGWTIATLLILAAGCQVLYRFVRQHRPAAEAR